jgi:sugar phosphate isomerase/epimerase
MLYEGSEARDQQTRRQFLQAASAAVMFAGLPRPVQTSPRPDKSKLKVSICVFSKHLQWLDFDGMAQTAAEIGFDGVDLTLRKGGHVEPERAGQDLPVVAEKIRKAGLALPMVTTGIIDAATPYAEPILRALNQAGISLYRWGGFRYVDGRAIVEQLSALRPRAMKLAELNEKYKVCAMYHTHSGLEVGAPIWDLWVILKELDPRWVSVNFDVAHATIEGGLGGWIRSCQLVSPWIRGTAIKDFRWGRDGQNRWEPQWCPLGEGMVNFKRYFGLLNQAGFSGPVQIHFEYPLGGAEHGAGSLSMERPKVIAAMRKDLAAVRGWLREAGLS